VRDERRLSRPARVASPRGISPNQRVSPPAVAASNNTNDKGTAATPMSAPVSRTGNVASYRDCHQHVSS
jgi:hypothetical protein